MGLRPPKCGALGGCSRGERGTHTARIEAQHVDDWMPSMTGKYQSVYSVKEKELRGGRGRSRPPH